jgi:MoaA/NifB/PqqE/SkfB family radical SAM enzyme
MVDVKFHMEHMQQSVSPKLKRLWIGVTDQCNSRCKTCNIWHNKGANQPLNHAEGYSFLASEPFKNVIYILNSGGEPTLVDIEEIMLKEHECLPKATIQLSTNGLLPDKALKAVKTTLETDAKVDVGISLDGIGADHDNWRGVKGNFEKVDYLIKALCVLKEKHCNLKVTVGSTLMPGTVLKMDELLSYAKKNDIPFMWHWFNRSSFYNNSGGDISWTPEVTKQMIEAIKTVHPDSLYRSWWINYISTNKIPSFKCYALKSFATIKSNGDVVPCLSHWDNAIGNVFDSEPDSLFKTNKAMVIRKLVAKCGNCSGCLNSWGCGWSLEDAHLPIVKWAMQNKRKKSYKKSL